MQVRFPRDSYNTAGMPGIILIGSIWERFYARFHPFPAKSLINTTCELKMRKHLTI